MPFCFTPLESDLKLKKWPKSAFLLCPRSGQNCQLYSGSIQEMFNVLQQISTGIYKWMEPEVPNFHEVVKMFKQDSRARRERWLRKMEEQKKAEERPRHGRSPGDP